MKNNHDHDRASDDGMRVQDDLGSEWGKSDLGQTEDSTAAAIRAVSEGKSDSFGCLGVVPTIEGERALAEQAKAMIDATVGHIGTKRYTLITYEFKDPDEQGAAFLDSYGLVSTPLPRP